MHKKRFGPQNKRKNVDINQNKPQTKMKMSIFRCWGDHWDAATGEEMDLNPHIPKPEPPPEPEKEEEKKEEEKKEGEEKKEEKEATTEKEEKKEEEKEKADEKKEGDEKKVIRPPSFQSIHHPNVYD